MSAKCESLPLMKTRQSGEGLAYPQVTDCQVEKVMRCSCTSETKAKESHPFSTHFPRESSKSFVFPPEKT